METPGKRLIHTLSIDLRLMKYVKWDSNRKLIALFNIYENKFLRNLLNIQLRPHPIQQCWEKLKGKT